MSRDHHRARGGGSSPTAALVARYLLYVAGADRPGIVAGVTEVLAGLGGNLEDSRMAILHGTFAIMLVVEAPGALSATALDEAFAEVRERFGLDIAIRPIAEHATNDGFGETVAVSVHGADRPGIVSAITAAVADLGGNIIDLATHKVGAGGDASYVLLLSVALAPECDEATLRDALSATSTSLGVTCVVHAGDDEL